MPEKTVVDDMYVLCEYTKLTPTSSSPRVLLFCAWDHVACASLMPHFYQ